MPFRVRLAPSVAQPNLYVHSGGGAYGWRVAMGVSKHLAELVTRDLGLDGGSAIADAPPPSLDAAAPHVPFDPSILSIDRFRQLPLWPRVLWGW